MKREKADPGTWSRRDVFRRSMATAAGVMGGVAVIDAGNTQLRKRGTSEPRDPGIAFTMHGRKYSH